jgi:hypothetical protein
VAELRSETSGPTRAESAETGAERDQWRELPEEPSTRRSRDKRAQERTYSDQRGTSGDQAAKRDQRGSAGRARTSRSA